MIADAALTSIKDPVIPSDCIHRLEISLAERVADTLRHAPKAAPTFSQMVPEVYEELRRIGRAMIRAERPGHTLQPTAVVNEAYLRLAGIDHQIHDRAHCFRLLAQAMRRVLIDHARAKARNKRERPDPEELERLLQMPLIQEQTPIDILDVDRALTALAEQNNDAAEMIQLHWYFGVDAAELGPMFRASEASVTRTLRFARAWLQVFVRKQGGEILSASNESQIETLSTQVCA